ncbi:MAG: N-acetyl sugar amidotransferase, partial [Candidatus Omnitrophica bacterium]|nr:N-acetyl sugar amidotransferase [Candidatus Omnitrophota bacterium]
MKKVKQDKLRKKTRYEKLADNRVYGKPLFDKELRYCARCCMPETAEALAFDEMGICQPCRSAEQKIHINWVEREKKLREILNRYRSKDGKDYDCMVPISGGKDSTFQLYVLTQVYKLKPLAVTFNHNWYSEAGKYNLQNALEVFDVDHIMFTPHRSAINKLAKKSLGAIGDSCWHCHAGVGAFPLQIAVKYGIKLIVWGESVSENDGRATYKEPIAFTREHFTRISARLHAEEMIDKEISYLDIYPYVLPSPEEMEKVG